ncbi:MAG: FAD-dependent monooxygenase, partial [Chloroflexi bacterium]|nr:FAD-dependent monooxygenase [Chloroflexota bacterium]
MKIACIGGGPACLFFAILMRKRFGHEVLVLERNAPEDTFGFGVVFSDETLGAIQEADPEAFSEVERNFAYWTDIDIVFKNQVITSGGHGFAALSRKVLLNILQQRAIELGADVRFRTEVRDKDVHELIDSHDLVLGGDGVNSLVRRMFAEHFEPNLDVRKSKYMWLGTTLRWDSFRFLFKETDKGFFQVHAYPFDANTSTFILETDIPTWRAAGLDLHEHDIIPPGQSDEESIAYAQRLFADELQGHKLIANNSKWLNFTTVRNGKWSYRNVAIVGDAAHTAHFSIGSGTKLAMEDSIALAEAFGETSDVETALGRYEAARRPVVESTQRAAQASLEWFEGPRRYFHQEPLQFAFNLMTRSRRVTYDNLKKRDEAFVERVD